ncbi:predicted protein [Sclerotinia sclerotiorum 1980 UF-70]|uniref:Uncharacterized protein n=1 Tax=Sclerotinia sclerotiorum (strain ATCC 18683 / 1980 / Ss-1) TaxID=665079 RepID=A7F4R1_SCLS1|nr:predicted protein [Sclerotinia sclerotiorum 1980 UF-70]EDN97732.1 predicted protein [Sclerotinia sclerotiorum 1980 UF-70]
MPSKASSFVLTVDKGGLIMQVLVQMIRSWNWACSPICG